MFFRHRDRSLVEFEWLEPEGIRIVSVDWGMSSLFPLEFGDLAGDERMLERRLEAWLKNRTAPMGRHFIRNLLAAVGLDARDPEFHRRALEYSMGLSLNDVYWVTADGFPRSWAECNLYQNEFSKTMAEIAFSGNGDLGNEAVTTSPEMTTNGMLPKCWRRIDGEIRLFKAGVMHSGSEPFAEYYAAQIAAAMGLNHVPYELAKYKGKLCSTCPLFTSEEVGYVPASRLANRKEMLNDPGFAEIFLFDAVIFNTDRHFGNFGYLVDNDSNRIIGPAPVFDNGYGLFSTVEPDEDLVASLRGRHPALFEHWMDIPGGLTAEMLAKIEKLRGFRFKRHNHYNMQSERLSAIEHFLQKRVGDILEYREKADKYIDISEKGVRVNRKDSNEDVRVNEANLDPFSLQLLWNIKANPLISSNELALILGRDERTIRRRIKNLRDLGIIWRKGPDKTGSWICLI